MDTASLAVAPAESAPGTAAATTVAAIPPATEITTTTMAPPASLPTPTTEVSDVPTAHDACKIMVTLTYDAMYHAADAYNTWSDALHSDELPDRETLLRLEFSLWRGTTI